LVNEHETISYSHKCVESIEEMPKLKLVREGHSSPVIKHRKTSLLTCKNFNIGKDVFQTTTDKLAICSAAVRFSDD
jgi:hypothetical protein